MCLFSSPCRRYGLRLLWGKALALLVLLAPPAAMAAPVTVLAMGDSLTQGYGLIEEEGFVPQLREWLSDNGVDARVINGGVSGDTASGGAARVEWSLTPEVDAMIVALGGNDLLRGIDPAVTRDALRRILEVAKVRKVEVLVAGLPAPGNYGPDYSASFAAIFPDLAARFDALHHPDFLAGLGRGTPEEMQALFQPDGIHPNGRGVAVMVRAIGPAVLDLIARAGAAGRP